MLPTEPTRQFALNVIAAVREGCGPALDDALNRIGQETLRSMQGPHRDDDLIAFRAIPGVHYARWVVLPGRGDPFQSPAGNPAPPGRDALALSAWYDGPEEQPHASERPARESIVRALVSRGRAAFDLLYENCEEYPVGASDDEVVTYLLKRFVPAATLYFGAPGRSLGQILAEADLAREVRRVVDELRAEGPLPSAASVRSHVLRRLGSTPPRFPPQEPAWAPLVGKALALLPLVPPVLLSLPWLLHLEGTDKEFEPVYSGAERAHVEETTRDADLFFQNALSNIVEVKPGIFRRLVLRLVLFVINALARDLFVDGSLGEIASIHAAHWYLLDGGRRLAFVSNYDSSWESYIGDFIERARDGLTAVWSNTSGYPQTTLLAFAGATAGDRFRAWSHHIQIRTRVWYAAYPSLSIAQINDATLIRRGLADPFEVPPEQWLKRLS
jgi:hypothetical protein